MINFYCFHQTKTLLVSDLPLDKIKVKYGHSYEIVNSIKDRSAIELITARVLRSYPGYIITESFQKIKGPVSEETKRKMSLAHMGKKRDELTKLKISQTMKGKSNFQGKKHTEESKNKTSQSMQGNTNSKDLHWAHDPRSDKETRVKNRHQLPPGFQLGRDYYSTETGLYYFAQRRSTNSPKGKLSNKDR